MRSLGFAVLTLATFFVNQLNNNIASLTAQLRAMAEHQIKADERIAAIEISRTGGMKQFDLMLTEFENMKILIRSNTSQVDQFKDILNRHSLH